MDFGIACVNNQEELAVTLHWYRRMSSLIDNRVLFFIYNRYACPAFGGSKGVGGGDKVKMPVSGSKITDFWLKIEQNAGYEILWIVDKI